MNQPKHSMWPTIFAGVVLALVLYVGAYFVLVDRYALKHGIGLVLRPWYPLDSLSAVFKPAHWIDRHILRPQYWEPTRVP